MGRPKKIKAVTSGVQMWHDRIKNALKERERVEKEYAWERIGKEIKGEYKKILGSMKGVPIIPVNLAHAFIRTAVPALYFRDPKISVNPLGGKYIERAKILEAVINCKWRKLKMKHEMKKVLQDTLGGPGHGWVKVGYTAEVEETDSSQITDKVQTEEPEYVTDQILKNENIWAYRVSPYDVVFNNDESIDPPYDCRWIAHRLRKPVETVKKMFPGNDELKQTYTSGSLPLSKDDPRNANQAKDQNLAGGIPMVELWEITDMDTRQIFYVVDGYDKLLAEPRPFPYEFGGFQWSMLRFNPVMDEAYPYSDLYVAEPQLWEIIKLISMALNHIKRFSRQIMVKEGALSETEKTKFEQGIDGAVITVKGDLGPEGPQPIPYPPIQVDLYNILDRLQMLFDTIVGQSSFDRGSTSATKSRTLGEVDVIQRSTGSRSSEKQDILEDFTEEVAEKIIALTKQYVDVPEFVAVTGLDPAVLNKVLQPPTADMTGKMADATGFSFTREDIQGKYDVSVVAGSMRPLDHERRNDILMQILRFGQAIGLQPNDPASNEIGVELFHNLDMVGVSQAFEQKIALSGMEQQVQQLAQQRQALIADIQKLQGMRGQAQPQPNGVPVPPR